MDYKEKLYKNYVSTHILPRKGETTLDIFKSKSVTWQKTFRRFLPEDRNAKIIDAGCGNGSIVWWLQQIGYTEAEGIDISSEQIEIARKLGVRKVYQADLKEFLRTRIQFYDIIILRDVIEHFKKEEIIEILEICCESLKNSGKIIIQVPNAESPFFGRIRYGDFTHEIAFTMSSLSQLLRMIGFTEIGFYPIEPLIYGLKSFVRFVLWKIIEAYFKFLLFVELGRGARIVTQDIIAVGQK